MPPVPYHAIGVATVGILGSRCLAQPQRLDVMPVEVVEQALGVRVLTEVGTVLAWYDEQFESPRTTAEAMDELLAGEGAPAVDQGCLWLGPCAIPISLRINGTFLHMAAVSDYRELASMSLERPGFRHMTNPPAQGCQEIQWASVLQEPRRYRVFVDSGSHCDGLPQRPLRIFQFTPGKSEFEIIDLEVRVPIEEDGRCKKLGGDHLVDHLLEDVVTSAEGPAGSGVEFIVLHDHCMSVGDGDHKGMYVVAIDENGQVIEGPAPFTGKRRRSTDYPVIKYMELWEDDGADHLRAVWLEDERLVLYCPTLPRNEAPKHRTAAPD